MDKSFKNALLLEFSLKHLLKNMFPLNGKTAYSSKKIERKGKFPLAGKWFIFKIGSP